MSVRDFGAAVRAADSALVLERDRSAVQLIYGQAYLAAHREHPVAAYHRARFWIIQGKELAEAERLLLAYLSGPELRSGASSRAGAHWRLGQLYDRLDREGDARAVPAGGRSRLAAQAWPPAAYAAAIRDLTFRTAQPPYRSRVTDRHTGSSPQMLARSVPLIPFSGPAASVQGSSAK